MKKEKKEINNIILKGKLSYYIYHLDNVFILLTIIIFFVSFYFNILELRSPLHFLFISLLLAFVSHFFNISIFPYIKKEINIYIRVLFLKRIDIIESIFIKNIEKWLNKQEIFCEIKSNNYERNEVYEEISNIKNNINKYIWDVYYYFKKVKNLDKEIQKIKQQLNLWSKKKIQDNIITKDDIIEIDRIIVDTVQVVEKYWVRMSKEIFEKIENKLFEYKKKIIKKNNEIDKLDMSMWIKNIEKEKIFLIINTIDNLLLKMNKMKSKYFIL